MTKTGSLTLRCPKCNRTQPYARSIDADIPDNVVEVQSMCPDCNPGDFDVEVWVDICGREVSQDIGHTKSHP